MGSLHIFLNSKERKSPFPSPVSIKKWKLKDQDISDKVKRKSNWFEDILTWNLFSNVTNTVINILKKQEVLAPWVIIHLLSHSSHILRTRESLIILPVSFIVHFDSKLFRMTEVFYWNKQDRIKLMPFILNNTWTWRKPHQLKLIRQSPRIFF